MDHLKLQRLQISTCWWIVSSWCRKNQGILSQIPTYTITNVTYFDRWLSICDGLEMSLHSIWNIDLFLSNNWIVIFLEQKKTYLYHSINIKGFSNTRSSNTFSIRWDTFWQKVKDFVKINLNFILKDSFYLGLVKCNP